MAGQITLWTPDEITEEMKNAPVVSGKQYFNDEAVTKLAEKVIKKREIPVANAVIDYRLVYPAISKTVAGKCKRMSDEFKHYTGIDYLILLSGELWETLDTRQKETLLWHELLHVRPIWLEDKGEWKMTIRQHDFEDFYEIYAENGINWIGDVKDKAQKIFELSNSQRDGISI